MRCGARDRSTLGLRYSRLMLSGSLVLGSIRLVNNRSIDKQQTFFSFFLDTKKMFVAKRCRFSNEQVGRCAKRQTKLCRAWPVERTRACYVSEL